MALDFDNLDSALDNLSSDSLSNNGNPLQINIEDIYEDPNQPRTVFNQEEINNLADSIRKHGLLTPISIKTHPENEKKWLLNNGARRFRACKQLGMKTIAAFVMNTHDDYAQIADNLMRDNFKPLELAQFIQKKVNEGEKKKDIAENMGIPPTMITTYLKMLEMPDCIRYIYDQGQTSPKIIYDLSKAYENYPTEIEDWITSINNIEDVTVKSVRELINNLKKPTSSISDLEDEEQQEIDNKKVKLKPVVLVKYNQEDYILVNKKTEALDTILIKQITDNKEIEVKASKCKLIGTTEI